MDAVSAPLFHWLAALEVTMVQCYWFPSLFTVGVFTHDQLTELVVRSSFAGANVF